MAMSRPRTPIRSRSESVNRFTREPPAPFADASHASPSTLAPGGSKPISASASIDFPLPDSPTRPSDSPVSSANETSSTGRIHPAGVGSSTVSPRSSISGAIGASPLVCHHRYIIRRISRGVAESSGGLVSTLKVTPGFIRSLLPAKRNIVAPCRPPNVRNVTCQQRAPWASHIARNAGGIAEGQKDRRGCFYGCCRC